MVLNMVPGEAQPIGENNKPFVCPQSCPGRGENKSHAAFCPRVLFFSLSFHEGGKEKEP